MSRIEKYRTEKRQVIKRIFIIGLVSLSTTFVVTTGVAFANSNMDISSMLQSWFNQKSNESITKIDEAVQHEVEQQKIRLKEEVQLKLQSSAEELNTFTEQKKSEIITSIQNHADQLIDHVSPSKESEEDKIKAQLESIQNEAIAKMELVTTNSSKTRNEELSQTDNEVHHK
jgi:preprotein translocase subunit SecD